MRVTNSCMLSATMNRYTCTPVVFLACAVTALGPVPALAEGRPTVAVLDLSASNAPAGEAAVISGFIRSAVVRTGTYDVVDKGNMDRILAEQAFQQTGCTSQECAIRLGKILNVGKMIVGEYAVISGVRFINCSLVDVETGKIERTASEKNFAVADIDTVAGRIADTLCGTSVPPVTSAPASTGGEGVVSRRIGVGIGFSFIPTVFKYQIKVPGATLENGPTFGGPVLQVSYRGHFASPMGAGFGLDFRGGTMLVGEGDSEIEEPYARYTIKGNGYTQIYCADAVALLFFTPFKNYRLMAGGGIGYLGFQEKSLEKAPVGGTATLLKGVGGVMALTPQVCVGFEDTSLKNLVFELIVGFTTGEYKTAGTAYDFIYDASAHFRGSLSFRYDFR